MQCHLGPELLCLLCKQQICMDRQAPALLVTATACAHNLPRKRLQQVYTALLRTQYLLESLMAAVVLQPHLHVSQAAVAMRHMMRQVIYDASEMQLEL